MAQPSGRPAVATTTRFAFYSDFATNLSDGLIAAGRARRSKTAELFRSGAEKACFDELSVAERAAWNRAVDYYAEVVSPGQFTDREQSLPRLELAGVVKKEALTNATDQRFLEIIGGFRGAAAPAYERCRWSAQDAANRHWIGNVLPLLARHEKTLGQRLSELYGTQWAGLPFRVDVVETVSHAGADSLNLRPPGLHILVSSANPGNQDRAALEVVFHEASHFLTGRDTPLREALEAAARNVGGRAPGDLAHPVHFFMTGEAVRRVLENAGEPPYTPYLYALSLFSGELRDALKKTWPAYMDGKRTLQDTAEDLIRALGK
ncbi:MAG: hypothetical protein ABIT71_03860 [Vicinamibacteraceae bacterium]